MFLRFNILLTVLKVVQMSLSEVFGVLIFTTIAIAEYTPSNNQSPPNGSTDSTGTRVYTPPEAPSYPNPTGSHGLRFRLEGGGHRG